MEKTLGELIVEARKRQDPPMTQTELASRIGMTGASLSGYENDLLKGSPDLRTLIRISEALNAPEILSYHCETCPIRQKFFIRRFPELNNINRDPALIVHKVQKELREGIAALQPLLDKMDTKGFASCPDYQQVLSDSMLQIMGTQQALEILIHEFLVVGILSPETLRDSLQRLQEWCEHRGHHIPAKTGTEG